MALSGGSQPNMKKRARRRFLPPYLCLASSRFAILLAVGLLAGLAIPCLADDGPKPDPSATATGHKSAVVDAAGHPFVVPEPTDNTAPDYAANKKAFDKYHAQPAKQPLT